MERLVRYGSINGKDDNGNDTRHHFVAAIEYDEIKEMNYSTGNFEVVGERIRSIYNVRGGLDYMRKYGVTKCCRWNSLQHLIDSDAETYKDRDFQSYEPVTI